MAALVRPGPEHELLNVFVGKWSTQGQTEPGPSAPAVEIVGTDTYEWLEGGFFLIHRVDVRIGDEHVHAIEIIGYDAASKAYPMRSFDSQGNAGTYQATVRDGVWTFTGESERATVVASDAGNTLTAKWERKSDGSNGYPGWRCG